MWGPVVLAEPTAPPVRDVLVKAHLRDLGNAEDELIAHYTATAVGHIQSVTSTLLAPREAVAEADDWSDLARLPVAPVSAVTEIAYVDVDGVERALSAAAYRLNGDSLGRGVCLDAGEAWPARQTGSRITVTMSAGYEVLPVELTQAALLLVGQWARNRMPINVGNIVNDLPNGFTSLIENHKRYLV